MNFVYTGAPEGAILDESFEDIAGIMDAIGKSGLFIQDGVSLYSAQFLALGEKGVVIRISSKVISNDLMNTFTMATVTIREDGVYAVIDGIDGRYEHNRNITHQLNNIGVIHINSDKPSYQASIGKTVSNSDLTKISTSDEKISKHAKKCLEIASMLYQRALEELSSNKKRI